MQKHIARIELVKDMIQQAIDRGATSVEQIHQYIADLPFEALEKSGMLDERASALREKKSRTIGVVYDAIRRINREVGMLVSDQLENLEDGHYVSKVLAEKAPAKKRRPRKKLG
ncbi:MAG TPA: hypothetical protein VHE37_09055 [Nevskiaceae bacterium]|nr:hypothetical protein [Nevskiaceae bacterium]